MKGLPESCDVAIVGAGPAGAATALALSRAAPERSLALIDAGVRQRPLHHETLVAEARPLLEQLGCWQSFLAARSPVARGTLAAWGGPEIELHGHLFGPPGQGWRVGKPELAQLMVDQARERGTTVAAETRLVDLAARTGGGWNVAVDTRGSAATLAARFVVDATGRLACVARRLGARKVRFDRLVGALVALTTPDRQVRVAGAFPAEADSLVEADELGFWYCAPCGGDRIVASFMTDADLARERGVGDEARWHELLRDAAIRERLGELRPDGPPTIRALDSHRLDRVTGDGWLAVGDAAATADYLASPGLREALETGVRAAAAVVDDLSGRPTGLRRYQRAVEQRFEELLLARKKIYDREQRWTEAKFWLRRQDRVSLAPDQLLAYADSAAHDARLDALGMHLPSDQLRYLCSLCVAPRLVQAVVRAFRRRYAAPSDRRLLLALQYLVDQGLIAAE